MKRNKLVVVGLVVIIAVIFVYLYQQKGKTTESATSAILTDPFKGIEIDRTLDEGTQNSYQIHIDQTKAAYDSAPFSWESWVYIGNLHKLFENYDKALLAYEEASILNKNNPLSYRNTANLYKNDLKDYEKAVEFYLLAIENTKDDPTLYIDLALVYENKQNEVSKAEAMYIKGLENTEDDSELLIRFIRFYQRQENVGKVKENAKKLLELYPNDAQLREAWGELAK